MVLGGGQQRGPDACFRMCSGRRGRHMRGTWATQLEPHASADVERQLQSRGRRGGQRLAPWGLSGHRGVFCSAALSIVWFMVEKRRHGDSPYHQPESPGPNDSHAMKAPFPEGLLFVGTSSKSSRGGCSTDGSGPGFTFAKRNSAIMNLCFCRARFASHSCAQRASDSRSVTQSQSVV